MRSMAFLSCQKEDIDELIILEEGEYETITLVTEPCGMTEIDIDPAIATGPFVTTSIDILGVLLYFFIAGTLLQI